MKYKLISTALLVISLMMVSSFGKATVLFEEDFESYASGSSLVGQNGWTRILSPSATAPIIITPGAGLSSQVANGHLNPGTGTEGTADKLLSGPLNPSGITILSYDAFAFSAGPQTHNTELSISDRTIFSRYGWLYFGTFNANCPGGWIWVNGGLDCFVGARDEAVKLEVIIDGTTNEAYGRLHHSGGVFETQHEAISTTQIMALDTIHMYQDYRRPSSYLGAEFDNIVVTTVEIDPPIAVAGTSLDGNNLLQFDASLSSNPAGNAMTFSWLVDAEATPRIGQITSISDLGVGNYNVTLTVEDTISGLQDIDTMLLGVPEDVGITPPPPTSVLQQAVLVIKDDIANFAVNSFDGPNSNVQENRRGALLNQLDNIFDAIGVNDFQGAIDLLNDFLLKTDGSSPPSDWIIESDAQIVNQAILDLISDIQGYI